MDPSINIPNENKFLVIVLTYSPSMEFNPKGVESTWASDPIGIKPH